MTTAPMTKEAFLSHVRALYRVANMSDSDNPMRPDWVKAEMAGFAGCAALDTMMRGMLDCGAINGDEFAAFYDEV